MELMISGYFFDDAFFIFLKKYVVRSNPVRSPFLKQPFTRLSSARMGH